MHSRPSNQGSGSRWREVLNVGWHQPAKPTKQIQPRYQNAVCRTSVCTGEPQINSTHHCVEPPDKQTHTHTSTEIYCLHLAGVPYIPDCIHVANIMRGIQKANTKKVVVWRAVAGKSGKCARAPILRHWSTHTHIYNPFALANIISTIIQGMGALLHAHCNPYQGYCFMTYPHTHSCAWNESKSFLHSYLDIDILFKPAGRPVSRLSSKTLRNWQWQQQ